MLINLTVPDNMSERSVSIFKIDADEVFGNKTGVPGN